MNMVDVAEAHGLHVEAQVLEAALGIAGDGIDGRPNAKASTAGRGRHPAVEHPESPFPSRPGRSYETPGRCWPRSGPCSSGACRSGYRLTGWRSSCSRAMSTWPEIGQVRLSRRVGRPSTRCLRSHDDAYVDIAGGRYDSYREDGPRGRGAAAPRGDGRSPIRTSNRVVTHPLWGWWSLSALLGAVFAVTYSVAGPAASDAV